MYATMRRYEGIGQARSEEIAKEVTESLLPSVSRLPGFGGYYLIDAGEGGFTSVSLFETAEEANESTRAAARWIRAQKLESALPNTPEITAGPVIAHVLRGAAVTNGVPGPVERSEHIVTRDEPCRRPIERTAREVS